MLTPADIKARFPAFSSVDNNFVQLQLDRSGPYFDVSRWDDLYDEGLAYWVAHELTLAARDNDPDSNNGGMFDGTIMKKVDQLQKSTSSETVKAAMDDPYMATVYGQRYVRLRNLVGIGAIAV